MRNLIFVNSHDSRISDSTNNSKNSLLTENLKKTVAIGNAPNYHAYTLLTLVNKCPIICHGQFQLIKNFFFF